MSDPVPAAPLPGEGSSLKARALWFTSRRRAEIRDEVVPAPRGSELLVRAVVSLISAGTELLVYRGELPADDDLGLETCAGSFGFPVKYAYQVIGEVVETGVDSMFHPGELVFAAIPIRTCSPFRARASSSAGSPVS